MRNQPISLFAKLLGAICAVVIAAFVLDVALAISASRGPLEHLAEENLRYFAQTRMEAVDRYITDRAKDLSVWSSFGTMDELITHDRHLRITSLLFGLQQNAPEFYVELMVVDMDGRIVASSNTGHVGETISSDDVDLTQINSGGYLIGEFPQLNSNSPWVLGHAIQSTLKPEPIGVLLAYLDWHAFVDLVTSDGATGHPQNEERVLFLVGTDGRVLAGNESIHDRFPLAAEALGQLEAGESNLVLEGRVDYLAAREVFRSNLSALDGKLAILALWKSTAAYGGVSAVIRANLLAAAVGIALSVAASFLIAGTIAGRVGKLADATQRLAAGDLSHRVVVLGNDELGGLARSFNKMAERLEEANRGLESSIARWRSLVQYAPAFILTIDPRSLVQFTNRGGSAPEDPGDVGASVESLFLPKYRDDLRLVVEQVLSRGMAQRLELGAAGPNGEVVLYDMRIGPIEGPNGVVGAVLVSSEINERREFERKALEITESERQRIGQDIHDGLGQVLTGTALISRRLQTRLEAQGLEEAAMAGRIGTLITSALGHTRALAKGLFPIALQSQGLQGALEELADSVEGTAGVACRIEGRTELTWDDRELATHLFRIAQEAVNNALRHGQVSEIVIRVGSEYGKNFLVVSDNGVGFNENGKNGHGMGLRLMEHRATMIGAVVEFKNNRMGGAVVRCNF